MSQDLPFRAWSRAASIGAALILLPATAMASPHSGFGGDVFDALATLWQLIGILGGIAMFAAGVLFWRLGMYRAVLACLAVQTLPGVITRTLVFLIQSGDSLSMTDRVGWMPLMQLVSGTVSVAQWAALVAAVAYTLARRAQPT
jgi:hypothetical protein